MSDVKNSIDEIKTQIQSDYEVLLETDPAASGRISVSFSVTPEGTVTEVLVVCPEELAGLQTSILSSVEELDFGPSSGQTEDIPVAVPFTLTPPQ